VEVFDPASTRVTGTLDSVDSLCRPDTDHIDNTASSSYSIVMCTLCLAMTLVFLLVYEAVAYQWVFHWSLILSGLMSQCCHVYSDKDEGLDG
jgi:hypothetical protein